MYRIGWLICASMWYWQRVARGDRLVRYGELVLAGLARKTLEIGHDAKHQMRAGTRGSAKNFIEIAAHWVVARLIYLVAGTITILVARPVTNEVITLPDLRTLVNVWTELLTLIDARWYHTIVEQGYSSEPYQAGKQVNWTFSPLFPAVLAAAGSSAWLTALLGNFAGVTGAWLSYLYLKDEIGEADARYAVLLLTYFPFSYALGVARPEAFLLFFWAFGLFAWSRERAFSAGVATFLAALTKPNGFLLSVVFAYALILRVRGGGKRPSTAEWFAVASGPLALAAFSVFAWLRTGDPFIWAKASRAWGADPFREPLRQIRNLVANPTIIDRWGWDLTLIHWLVFAGALAGCVALLLARRHVLAFFAGAVSVFSFISLGVWVHGRHVSANPAYFAGLALIVKSNLAREIVLLMFAAGLGAASVLTALRVHAFIA